MQSTGKTGAELRAMGEGAEAGESIAGAERDFERLGENAASLVRGTFSVVNDLMEELSGESRMRSAVTGESEEGEEESPQGRFRSLSARYPVAVAVAAGFAGLLTGAVAAGAVSYSLREGRRTPNEQLRRLSRAVPRLVNRWAKKVA